MTCRSAICALFLLPAFLLLVSAAPASAQEVNSAASLLPADAPIVLEIPDAAGQVDELRGFLTNRGFYESPAWAALQKNPGFVRARMGVLGLAGAAGMTPWEAIGLLVGDDLALTLLPAQDAGGGQRLLAVARVADVGKLDRFLDQLNIAAGVADESIEQVGGGGRLVTVNPELSYGRSGAHLIVGNEREHVRSALQLAAAEPVDPGPEVVAAAPADARARLRIDLAGLRRPGGPLAGSDPMNNPLGGYLLGGWVAALRSGSALDGRLTSGEDGMSIELSVAMEALPGPPRDSFFKGNRPTTAWRAEDLPRALGEIRVDRDWARLFADREQILSLEAANGVANFSAGLTTLMGGLDFMDELLPRVTGPVRLVAAVQDFSDMDRAPSPKFPAFALAVPLELGDDDVLRDRLQSAALGALTLIGFNQGQNQQPQLMTKLGMHKGHQVIYANYAAPMPAEQHQEGDDAAHVAPVQYNFEPAVAIVGNELLVATTYDLLRDIIDLKEAAGQLPAAAEDDVLWIDAGAAERALRANTEELIMNRMLEQNESRAQATAMFEALFQALRLIESAGIVSRATDDGVSVTLSLGLNDSSVKN